MSRPTLEVADIFRRHGPAWREQHRGHISLGQLKAMSAIERCRRAELGGHVLRCEQCAQTQIAYNSCRNRHCPKCQATAARQWLEARQAELLPVAYFHVVFNILFQAAAETLLTIAGDTRHLGAQIGVTMVLHTWGSAMTHHPHVHCIVPGGGISIENGQWVNCKPGFFLPVRVLSRLFRRLFLEKLGNAYQNGELNFYAQQQALVSPQAFAARLKPLREIEWVVYAKRPFAGPESVLAYLARYTHRVAIANSRLLALDEKGVTFRWKDYRSKQRYRHKTMTLSADEFIRRFLLHILPRGFHRIRYYGLFANTVRVANLVRTRKLLNSATPATQSAQTLHNSDTHHCSYVCRSCASPMTIIYTFKRIQTARGPPPRRALP